MGLFDFFSKDKKKSLDQGLEKTKKSLFERISKAVVGKSKVDEEVLDELEGILIASDVGVNTTLKIIERLEERVAKDKYVNTSELNNLLYEEVAALMSENKSEDIQSFDLPTDTKPYVIMVVGVNGVGKTTTIGKLAAQYKKQGKKVLLGAADTFRAAAVDQLILWGERVGVPVVSKGMNADPASVAFDTVKQGIEEEYDVIIIDTAGRLHTKVNLMNELSKIRRVQQKVIEEAPHEVLLVLDGSTGQNAAIQAREFTKATEVSSLAITKLDGTAKGGVVIGISDEFRIPVKYIGVGEKVEDLQPFNKMLFVKSLFDKE
ncbi:signal recognition particle-docking protein FtsY [Rapidithrix thailandica]|uniref:Signal recognition particle receptor FtsY n=1 Tax=Rapidithrix thailandica TaxID=413964 RepID=A0AAW9SCF9_9BACT